VDQAGTADDAVAWPQDQGVEVGENWSQGFNDNEMQSAFSSGNQDTQNSITSLVNDSTNIFNNNPFLINALKTGTQWQAQKAVGGLLANELGLTGVGVAGGLPGMALGWLVGKAFDFFTGKGKDETGIKNPENVFGLPLTDTGSKDEGKEEEDYFKTKEYLGSDEADRAREEEEDRIQGVDAGTADVQDYADIYEPPTPVYTPPSPVRDSGNGDSGGGGGGWSGSGGRSDDSWDSSPFNKGGRVDKALAGRSRDI